jgi:hypothetical protein
MNTWTITLHAEGSPLADARTRETVLSAAHGLAERFGIEVAGTEATPGSFSVTLGADEATAVGFAAELRRTTNAWHQGKHGGPLWVTPRE